MFFQYRWWVWKLQGWDVVNGQYFLVKLNYFIVFYRRRSRSPTPRRRKSRSPAPKQNKRQRRSTSTSPLRASPSVHAVTKETRNASQKLKIEAEEKQRYNYRNYSFLSCSFFILICFILLMCLFTGLIFPNLSVTTKPS